MQIELVETSEFIIAREDSSNGEFYLKPDGSVWYRNDLAADGDCFVNSDLAAFRQAIVALHRYNADVVTTADEQTQLGYVRRLAEDLRQAEALPSTRKSFWPLIVEQAEHGMI